MTLCRPRKSAGESGRGRSRSAGRNGALSKRPRLPLGSPFDGAPGRSRHDATRSGRLRSYRSPPTPMSLAEGQSRLARHEEIDAAGPHPGSPRSKPKATPIGELTGAEDFDPPPGDQEEHSEEVALAVDGDPSTAWTTEKYSGGFAGVGKEGVGLIVDAGSTVQARELEVDTQTPGWSGEVYAANQQAPDLAGWGKPVGSISNATEAETVPIKLSEPSRYYLVWIHVWEMVTPPPNSTRFESSRRHPGRSATSTRRADPGSRDLRTRATQRLHLDCRAWTSR